VIPASGGRLFVDQDSSGGVIPLLQLEGLRGTPRPAAAPQPATIGTGGDQ
jgi:hypothetical protein